MRRLTQACGIAALASAPVLILSAMYGLPHASAPEPGRYSLVLDDGRDTWRTDTRLTLDDCIAEATEARRHAGETQRYSCEME